MRRTVMHDSGIIPDPVVNLTWLEMSTSKHSFFFFFRDKNDLHDLENRPWDQQPNASYIAATASKNYRIKTYVRGITKRMSLIPAES